MFRDIGCIWPECFGTTIRYFKVVIYGRRPEPDGGNFTYGSGQWP